MSAIGSIAYSSRRVSVGLLESERARPEGCTFNICSNVVLPALSRPRKRSLACLLRSPSEARTSQTFEAPEKSALVTVDAEKKKAEQAILLQGKEVRWQLTPVDDEHAQRS